AQMKSQDFVSVLKEFGDVLEAAGARNAKEQLVTLSAVFNVVPQASVSEVVKRLKSLPSSEDVGSPNIGYLARLLSPLRRLLNAAQRPACLQTWRLSKGCCATGPPLNLTRSCALPPSNPFPAQLAGRVPEPCGKTSSRNMIRGS